MLNRLLNRLRTPDAVERARTALHSNQQQQAIDVIEPYLTRHSSDAEAHFLHGTALLELGQAQAALPSLNRAAELAPAEWRYLHNLAMASWTLGDGARAAGLCRRVIAQIDHTHARLLLARIELPGEDYLVLIERLHQRLRPATYIEIGVFRGWSLRLVQPETQAIGIDPDPQLEQPPGPLQRVYSETSDDFFATHDVVAELGGRRVEMAFIDGMHRFEYALRDFINIERLARPDSVVLVHDCRPMDAESATRERNTGFWSGDVWRMILVLKKYRPDLVVRTIAAPPTGLGLILNLDPQSRVLSDQLPTIIDEFMAMEYAALDEHKDEALNLFPNDWAAIQKALAERPAAAA